MTDQELAKTLFDSGLLTKEQVQSAAAQRAEGRNFARTVVALGWLTPEQIQQFDANAFGNSFPVAPMSNNSKLAQRFPIEAFERPVQANASGQSAPPIPAPNAPPFQQSHTSATYEKYDSSRLLFYSIIGALGCGLAAIICFFYSLDGFSKVQSGRIDPVHKTKISISLGLNILGIIIVVLARVITANTR